MDSTHTAHYLPATHPHGSDRTHVCSNGVVDISHAMPSAGSSLEQGKLRAFDYPLISSQTHWPAGKQLTFALETSAQRLQPRAHALTLFLSPRRRDVLVEQHETSSGDHKSASAEQSEDGK